MDQLTLLLYIALIYIVIYVVAQLIGFERLSERGIEASTPLFILFKTERLNSILTRAGKRVPHVIFNIGIFVAFGGMIFGFYMLGVNFINFFVKPSSAGGVVPIIPGVTITGLPLLYIIIALAITLITHEFAHGLASARDGITIKSSGLLFFYVLFGGFVEPDEEEFENKATPRERMRLLAAGSWANLITAFIVFLLISNFAAIMSVGFNPPSGAYIYEVMDGSPADGNLVVGDVIVALNGTPIDGWSDIHQYMANTTPGALLIIDTTTRQVNVTLGTNQMNSSIGYIGIIGVDYWEPKPGWEWIPGGPMFAFHAAMLLQWTFIILFSVAIFNLLPIPMLDGDKLLSNALSLRIKDEKKIQMIMWPIRIIALIIVLGSMILSLIMGKGLF